MRRSRKIGANSWIFLEVPVTHTYVEKSSASAARCVSCTRLHSLQYMRARGYAGSLSVGFLRSALAKGCSPRSKKCSRSALSQTRHFVTLSSILHSIEERGSCVNAIRGKIKPSRHCSCSTMKGSPPASRGRPDPFQSWYSRFIVVALAIVPGALIDITFFKARFGIRAWIGIAVAVLGGYAMFGFPTLQEIVALPTWVYWAFIAMFLYS